MISGLRSKLTCFCGGVEIDFILLWGSKLTWSLCGGSKLTWRLCAGRKLFSVRGSIDLFFVWVVENDFVFVRGLRSLGGIRGTFPGFLWGYGSWGVTDLAPCC